jgi:hypothetical protein
MDGEFSIRVVAEGRHCKRAVDGGKAIAVCIFVTIAEQPAGGTELCGLLIIAKCIGDHFPGLTIQSKRKHSAVDCL